MMSRKERSDVEDGDGGGDSGDGDAVMLSSGRVTVQRGSFCQQVGFICWDTTIRNVNFNSLCQSSETELVSSAQIKLTDSSPTLPLEQKVRSLPHPCPFHLQVHTHRST